jgi:branched-chain amino acid transport system permease protein
MKAWGTSTELGLLVGVAVASLLGLIFGALAARRQGIYFAMITLALAQLCYFIFLQSSFTGGEDGIQGIPRGNLFGLISLDDDLRIYYFVAALCVLGFYVVYRVQHSPFGNLLRAIRDNESRMISLGYDTTHYKLAVFIISAALSGLAGGLKVLTFQVATLTDVNYYVSAEVILMVLLGGVGTFAGPIVGAAVVVAAGNYLATSSLPVSIMLGVIFVVCTLCFKRGLVGETLAFFGRHRGDSKRLHAGIA